MKALALNDITRRLTGVGRKMELYLKDASSIAFGVCEHGDTT
jgi:hypothetical protein